MRRFTIMFLLFAYLFGAMVSFVNGSSTIDILPYSIGGDHLYQTPSERAMDPNEIQKWTQDPSGRSYWFPMSAENLNIGDMEGTDATNQGFIDTVTDAMGGFASAITTFFKILSLSITPLSYSTGVTFIDALFKSFWAVALTLAYIDLGKEVINVAHKVMVAVGSLIPFT